MLSLYKIGLGTNIPPEDGAAPGAPVVVRLFKFLSDSGVSLSSSFSDDSSFWKGFLVKAENEISYYEVPVYNILQGRFDKLIYCDIFPPGS